MTIRIFLADDHGLVRAGLRLLLETQPDLSVIGEAADGRQAVYEVARLRPDIAVLDITMPALNGIEALRRIRTECPGVGIIILSMHNTHQHIYRALKAGARGYVLKEAAGDELIEAIRTVYAGGRHLSPKISDELIEDYLAQHGPGEMENPIERLSSREREILQLVAEGKTSLVIANLLALSPKTVETYRSRLMQKLALNDLASLVKFAIQQGLVTLE
jgi:DNA-binding NarL/FixJ family response regulator